MAKLSKNYLFLTLKVLLLVGFSVYVGFATKSVQIVGLSLLEFFGIFCLQGVIPGKNRILRTVKYLLSSILLLLSLSNLTIYLFSRTYLSYLMTSNAENLGALNSGMPAYITGISFIVVAAFLPMRVPYVERRNWFLAVLFILPLAAWSSINLYTPLKTPLFAYGSYLQEVQKMASLRTGVSNSKLKAIEKEFRKSTIPSGIHLTHPGPLNVIVIFTEGTSSEVLAYDNGKLMPNLNQFASVTNNFTNYYNQSAATFRGVRGQLFSSQQFDNGYENGTNKIKQNLATPLVSVQSILANYGYQTEFFNAEPNEPIWTDYVNNLGFQKVVTGKTPNKQQASYVSDQDNYKHLFSDAEKLNNEGKPFMLADYTFQTHLSLNSSLTYGDGSNSLLNKFHNVDDAFGKFWQQFQKSGLDKNTILIFTADHATFPDAQYLSTFNTQRAYFLSTVPLMIYYPGVQAKTYDMGGRNSLGLAPTIMNLVGISKANNYFLGTSLYLNNPSPFEYITDIPPADYETKNVTEDDTRQNKDLASNDIPTLNKLRDFYKLSLNE